MKFRNDGVSFSIILVRFKIKYDLIIRFKCFGSENYIKYHTLIEVF